MMQYPLLHYSNFSFDNRKTQKRSFQHSWFSPFNKQSYIYRNIRRRKVVASAIICTQDLGT